MQKSKQLKADLTATRGIKCEIHDYCERIGCVETDKIIGIFEKLERTETNGKKFTEKYM